LFFKGEANVNTNNNSASIETRRRLIEAAGEVFAEHGYQGATVRDICRRAGANGAAVNYHFRDKAELYDTVLRYAHCAAQAEFNDVGPCAGASAEHRLGHFVGNFLLRVLDEGRPTWHGKLVSREMTEPTAALQGVIEETFRPRTEALRRIVRDLLGPAADELEIDRVVLSIFGQCVIYTRCKPVVAILHPWVRYDRAGIEAIARHVTDFTLRALTARRKELASGAPSSAALAGAGVR
jgi:TetR/AcrR family transcriptional regulator, regulator of cefoperazone and chloramphenicol sensitivity